MPNNQEQREARYLNESVIALQWGFANFFNLFSSMQRVLIPRQNGEISQGLDDVLFTQLLVDGTPYNMMFCANDNCGFLFKDNKIYKYHHSVDPSHQSYVTPITSYNALLADGKELINWLQSSYQHCVDNQYMSFVIAMDAFNNLQKNIKEEEVRCAAQLKEFEALNQTQECLLKFSKLFTVGELKKILKKEELVFQNKSGHSVSVQRDCDDPGYSNDFLLVCVKDKELRKYDVKFDSDAEDIFVTVYDNKDSEPFLSYSESNLDRKRLFKKIIVGVANDLYCHVNEQNNTEYRGLMNQTEVLRQFSLEMEAVESPVADSGNVVARSESRVPPRIISRQSPALSLAKVDGASGLTAQRVRKIFPRTTHF